MRARTLIPILLAIIGFSGAAFIFSPVAAPTPAETNTALITVSNDQEASREEPASQKAYSASAVESISEEIEIETKSVQPNSNVYVIPILSATTVLYAMEAYAVADPDFSFSGRDFAGLGLLVEEISGRKNSDGFYWTLFINNALSEKGASSAEVSPGDTVEWRYQKGI